MNPLTFIITIGVFGIGFAYYRNRMLVHAHKRKDERKWDWYELSLLVFFLALSLYLAWFTHCAEQGFAFSMLRLSWVPGWFHYLYAFLALLLAAYLAGLVKPSGLVWEKRREEIRGVLSFFALVLMFFATASFVFVDSEEIAKKTVLPLPGETSGVTESTMQHEGAEAAPSILTNSSNLPRMRLLTTRGEFWSRIMFPLFGGFIAAMALFFTYQRTTAIMKQAINMEKQLLNNEKQLEVTQFQLRNTEKTLENSRRQIIAEQFKNAINQLGNEKQAVVLGGIHTLHTIARNEGKTEEYSKTVFELLCSIIREETTRSAYRLPWLEEDEKTSKKQDQDTFLPEPPSQAFAENVSVKKSSQDSEEDSLKDDTLFPATGKNTAPTRTERESQTPHSDNPSVSPIVIQTILDKLFREEKSREIYADMHADLRGAFLRKAHLSRSFLRGVLLENSDLREAQLVTANLQEARLAHADLRKARLYGANLHKAQLYGTDFREARLEEADLREANLVSTNFRDAYLEYAVFRGTRSYNANFQHTRLKEANFQEVNFVNVDFQGANMTEADFQGSYLEKVDMRTTVLSHTDMRNSYLFRADLRGAWLNKTIFDFDTKFNAADFRGAQSTEDASRRIKLAYRNRQPLETDLSGVRIFKQGNEIPMTPEEKIQWFRKRRAIVETLEAEAVQEVFRERFS